MIQLLFLVVFVEGTVTLLLMVKIGPFRELVMKVLDQLKAGKGPATMKTLACTLSVILVSMVASILNIRSRGTKLGTITPMDQVLWKTHLLEGSLIGFILLLALVIDCLHHYLRKLTSLKKTISTYIEEVEYLKNEQQKFKDKEEKSSNEIKKLHDELSNLTEWIHKLNSDSEEQEKRAVSAEAHVTALRRQCEELLLEYDRLLEDNQILQTQALYFRG